MRLVILFIVMIELTCCREKSLNNTTAIIHDTTRLEQSAGGTLTSVQLQQIKRIHDVFSEVNSAPFRKTIEVFQNDRDPNQRIILWLKMAEAYERFTFNKHVEEHDKKEEAYQIIVMRSTMNEGEVRKKINARYLSENEMEEVLGYCQESLEKSETQR